MLHQDSHAVLNEELQREKDELKNELEMAEKRLISFMMLLHALLV